MTKDRLVSCPLYRKRNGCCAKTSGQELCDFCLWIHPAAIRPWRDTHREFDDFFKWIDEHNEKSRTCVIRRQRYAGSAMAADVLEAWKRSGDSVDTGIFWCEDMKKDHTVCVNCLERMSEEVREEQFNEDNTVKEKPKA